MSWWTGPDESNPLTLDSECYASVYSCYMQHPPTAIVFHTGDILVDRTGKRYVIDTGVEDDDGANGYLILRPDDPAYNRYSASQSLRYLTYDEFGAEHWTHIPTTREGVR